ncbi:uncharacterized protein CMC5_084840 [Chondromyces crocatus]|uniref:CENP-V/GFA domain-containing protein n=1 Tax=Chondromyces crocatus TaxID=52 RepID=A0A0K1EJC0_CHOCO|nr:uncharacterized protein CMC5_084840 [Chondromyces crocatus]
MPLLGSCHCGGTHFEVSDPPSSITRCNCSFCFKRGVLWAYYSPDRFKLLSNEHDVICSRNGVITNTPATPVDAAPVQRAPSGRPKVRILRKSASASMRGSLMISCSTPYLRNLWTVRISGGARERRPGSAGTCAAFTRMRQGIDMDVGRPWTLDRGSTVGRSADRRRGVRRRSTGQVSRVTPSRGSSA